MGIFRSLFRRRRMSHEIDAELASHLEHEVAHRVSRGMSPDDARRTALKDFGSVTRTREEVRDARGLTFWDVLGQDLRFGVRSLRRSPGYLLAAVTILALGIGANTAMFSVIDGVLLKPLPFRQPDRIVLVEQSTAAAGPSRVGVSLPEYFAYRDRLKTVRDLVEYHQMAFVLLGHGDPDKVDTGVVSANFFGALGVQPLVGRDFVAADAVLGAPPVVLLTYEYWQTKFGSDPKIVGQLVRMNDKVHEIVGVLPPFPQYPQRNDIYMPTSACPFRSASEQNLSRTHRMFSALTVFGWLQPGATPASASSEIAGVSAAFVQDHAQDYARAAGFTGRANLLSRALTIEARPMVAALGGATLLVLIIACANVANLAVTRALRRQRELAVRTALGAGRGRLARQLITESLLVAIAGGAAGLLVARGSLALLVPFIGRFTERTGQIAIDTQALMFTLVATLVTGVVCGVAPVLGQGRSLVNGMREGGSQAGESRTGRRLRTGLVVAQVTVSFVLLIGAALLLQSVYRMAAVPLGFDTTKVTSADLRGNFSRFQTQAEVGQFYADTLERLRATPGVAAAAATGSVPLSNIQPGPIPFTIGGQATDGSRPLLADRNSASDGYFDTLGVPLLMGRDIARTDTADSARVVVINAAMAALWDGRNPIGATIEYSVPTGPGASRTVGAMVIGVVRDFRLYGATTPIEPQFYEPIAQSNFGGGRLVVRAQGDPADLAATIRSVVHAIADDIPVEDVRTLAELQDGRLRVPSITAGLLAAFAGVALLITLAGIAGLIGNAVSQRTREFGVRLALGARPWRIVGGVVRQGLVLSALGAFAGAGGALLFSRMIVRYLFETRPADPLAYAAVAAIFIAASALAAFIPARRIVRIDPLKVLRTE